MPFQYPSSAHKPYFKKDHFSGGRPAFGAGAVVGGALNNQRPAARGYSNRHYQWCSSRYRTYRASDNTYVPSAGRRAICNSPYS
ncbi:BA14K family protein [Brucella thiophenivorans]|uniref:BA14K family protein n=1 Tax=Brucella thiophenivorans TaxID=571255 RepID=UPI001F457FE8|nr:BA14K family protein [Brucella thiophenivorans]